MLPEISKKFKERGDGCYNLIVKMLSLNPEERPTAVQVLQHKFFIGIKKQPIEHEQLASADDEVEILDSFDQRNPEVSNILLFDQGRPISI